MFSRLWIQCKVRESNSSYLVRVSIGNSFWCALDAKSCINFEQFVTIKAKVDSQSDVQIGIYFSEMVYSYKLKHVGSILFDVTGRHAKCMQSFFSQRIRFKYPGSSLLRLYSRWYISRGHCAYLHYESKIPVQVGVRFASLTELDIKSVQYCVECVYSEVLTWWKVDIGW